MGYVDVQKLTHVLPDGRVLFDDVSFRVGEGAKTALVGANGTGKTTLLRMIAGDLAPAAGSVAKTGGLGVMRQFIGSMRDDTTVRDLLLSLAAPDVRDAGQALDAAELAMMESDDERTQLRYASALADWGDAGGYDAEVLWDVCTVAALGVAFERCQYRAVHTLSGGEQKRLALEALLRGPAAVLLLDEPDNYLDVPGKRWLEAALVDSRKTVLFVSHDRELLARTATRVVTLEAHGAWVHGGGFATYAEARAARRERLAELHKRWDEEHARLRQLMFTLRQQAAISPDMASRYSAAVTRLEKFEAAGRPPEQVVDQKVTMKLRGGRTGVRALVCQQLELTGLMQPFDLEVFYGERLAVLGFNGSGKSMFLRLLAGQPVAHTGQALSAPASCRAGLPRPMSSLTCTAARSWTSCTVGTSAGGAWTARRRSARCAATSCTGRPTRSSIRSQAASRPACRCCCSSSPARRCCCSTSRPTTSTSTARRRSRRAWRRTRARCSR
jgi:ATPase subunit of ABC transporter with duplicated ATPase domains